MDMQTPTIPKIDMTARGLTPDEVARSRKEYGENRITRQKRKGFLRQFAASFGDPVVKIPVSYTHLTLPTKLEV